MRLRDELAWFENLPDWTEGLPDGGTVPFPGSLPAASESEGKD